MMSQLMDLQPASKVPKKKGLYCFFKLGMHPIQGLTIFSLDTEILLITISDHVPVAHE